MRLKLGKEVHGLVQGLSSTEKAYVKKWGIGQPKSKISKGFDILNSFQEFDEEAIQKKFKAEKINPKDLYTRLLQTILKSLRQFNSGGTIELQLWETIINSKLLLDKKFSTLGLNQLEKGLDVAEKNEQYLEILELNQLHQAMRILASEPSKDEDEHNYLSSLDAIKQLELRTHYRYLFTKLMGLTREVEDTKNGRQQIIDDILNHPSLRNEERCSSKNQLLRNRLLAAGQFFVGRWEDALEACREILNQLPDFEKGMPKQNIGRLEVLANLTAMCKALYDQKAYLVAIRMFEEAKPFVDELPLHTQVRIEEIWEAEHHSNALLSGQLERSIELAEAYLSKPTISANPVNGKTVMLGIALAQYYTGQFSKAIQYINTEFLMDESDYLNDRAKWLELLCLFELEDASLFESKWRSRNRQLKKANSGYEWEDIFMKVLNKSYGKPIERRKSMMKELHSELLGFTQELRTSLTGAIDLIIWAESQAERRPMILLIKERYLS